MPARAMESLCLAELLAGLSVVADVGMGLEPGEAARASLVAVELAAAVGAPDPSDVYYTTLLQHIGLAARIAQVAIVASLFYGLGGLDVALEALRRRAGATLDPHLVDVMRQQGKRILGVLSVADAVSEVVNAEPQPAVRIGPADL